MRHILILPLALLIFGCSSLYTKTPEQITTIPTLGPSQTLNGLRFTISTSKDKYLLEEPITIEYKIENVTKKPILICKYSDSGENDFRRNNQPTGFRHGDRINNKPDKIDFVIITNSTPLIQELVFSDLKLPGKYDLSLYRTYRQTGKEYGFEAWVGSITTNVSFEISE